MLLRERVLQDLWEIHYSAKLSRDHRSRLAALAQIAKIGGLNDVKPT